MKFKEIFMPAFKLIVICFVSALLLAVTNYITAGKIAESEKKQEQESKKTAFSSATSFGDDSTLPLEDKEIKYCVAYNSDGEVIGYVFTSSNRGYGGDVSVMTGINSEGTVQKTVILSMDDETPGLGQNAGKDGFLTQFSQKTGPFSLTEDSNERIEGVTSATFTSKAVIASVNDAYSAFDILNGGGIGNE